MSETPATDAAPSFEESLKRLEALVQGLEAGETPLAELLSRFEEGTALLRACEAKLREAELRIEQLRTTKDAVQLEKFQTTRS